LAPASYPALLTTIRAESRPIRTAGAQYGFGLLWTTLLTTPLMVAIQLAAARIGRVTGQGLAANLAAHYPRPLVIFLAALLVGREYDQHHGRYRGDGRSAANGWPAAASTGTRCCSRCLIAFLQVYLPYTRTGRGLQVADARAARLRGRAVLCER